MIKASKGDMEVAKATGKLQEGSRVTLAAVLQTGGQEKNGSVFQVAGVVLDFAEAHHASTSWGCIVRVESLTNPS